jgi:putative transposase
MKLISSKINQTDNPIIFFTATMLKWQPILNDNERKDIIISSLTYLYNSKKIKVGGFVVMPNHIHLILRLNDNYPRKDFQRDFLKYTAQQIKFHILKTNEKLLNNFVSTQKDRAFQIWERNPLSVELYNLGIVNQKLEYIHQNPCTEKWKLSESPNEYKYSSCRFYYNQLNEFNFITHINEL